MLPSIDTLNARSMFSEGKRLGVATNLVDGHGRATVALFDAALQALESAGATLVRAPLLPLVAIGDITPADAPALSRTGVAGLALVRAVMEAPDPAAAVREVLEGMGTRPRP